MSDRFTLFLHDYNLAAIEGGFETTQELVKYMSTNPWSGNIAAKFPIQVNNYEDLKKWSSLKTTTEYYTLQYHGIMKDNEFVDFIKEKENDTIIKKFEYFITKNGTDENDFIINLLPKIFRQVIFSRSHRIKILLKYEPSFFSDERWCKVIDFINIYSSSLFELSEKRFKKILPYDSVFSFAKHLEENPVIKMYPFTKKDAREIFQFVRENNYELFSYFYECHRVRLRGGELHLV